ISQFTTLHGKSGTIVDSSSEELIDEEHPQKYKTVKFGDIKSYLMQVGPTLGGPPFYFLL
ncbi:hypothetical protein SUGI_0410630, partial [Cryptomeria japonica]